MSVQVSNHRDFLVAVPRQRVLQSVIQYRSVEKEGQVTAGMMKISVLN